jgi:hypothetical protein
LWREAIAILTVRLPTLNQPAGDPEEGPPGNCRTLARWPHIGGIVLVLGTISAIFEQTFAVGDAYFLCKGSIGVISTSVTTPVEGEEIAMHITPDRVNISGNAYFGAVETRICGQTADEFYFDSQTCSGSVDLSRPRGYGTFNKITGRLDLSSENHFPNVPILLTRGQFICKKTEPVMK